MSSRFTEADFGVTHLASLFHQDWRTGGSDRELVSGYVNEMPIPYVRALGEDALALVASGPPAMVATLWECATGSNHRVGVDAALAWFQSIVSISEIRLAGVGQPQIESVDRPDDELRERVIREIDQIVPSLDDAIQENAWKEIPGVVKSLRFCATVVSPDLAFRFLLRAVMEYSCRIEPAQYARLVELGRDFGYGEFVVSRAEYLTRD
ncbi:hypothetical protein GCM10029976_053000 [Kribbella albertanoniae]|uniref:Uncharacterized protein n=1 Tax=Kribbella albertanoniae TaxID=1266829 RepID=A0A4R4P8R4_9ACTN|nr:hypothetical protein [Kribbella albertanoniae]TDC16612.1 hypothetical protein E1261_38645 [Kribbella albertanoniae]